MLKHATLTRPGSRIARSPMQRLDSDPSSTKQACISPGLDQNDNFDSTRKPTILDEPHETFKTGYHKDLNNSHPFNSSAATPNSKANPFARRQLDFSDQSLESKTNCNIDNVNNNHETGHWLADTSEGLSNQVLLSTNETNTFNLNNLFSISNSETTCTTPSSISLSPCKQAQSNTHHKVSLATHLLNPNRCRNSVIGFGRSSKSTNNMFVGSNNCSNDIIQSDENKLERSHFSQPTFNTSSNNNKNINTQSMIKVFAQTLSQDVEYKTLQVTSQTRSSQIVRSLLKKFRLKHRDPNLYYLTLERWIRKDGIKSRNVMILSDDSCPLQLQQCCSNPPHDDIKFTLQMRAGALVKIYCSDIVQDSRYKCLSLSAQTTVEETIELMVQCLNLQDKLSHQSEVHSRITNSPGSIMSTNSSSSGIESDQNQASSHSPISYVSAINDTDRFLNNNSKASSITSISTSSNASITDQYCLIIECKDTNYRRILDSDEYLVDVYEGLLAEARGQSSESVESPTTISSPTYVRPASRNQHEVKSSLQNHNFDFVKTNPDQWFLIKLVRRDDFNIRQQYPMSAIRLANPRHSPPPQIPSMPKSMLNSTVNMKNVVSTTQIEVVNGHFSSHSLSGQVNANAKHLNPSGLNNPLNQRSTVKADDPPNLPPKYVMVPPIKPRRNISMVSSSFGRPLVVASQSSNQATNIANIHNASNSHNYSEYSNLHSLDHRRRYDPARLAEDLSLLDSECSDN